MDLLSFEVFAMNKLTPCKITLEYITANVNLVVYMSYTNKYPSEASHDYKAVNVTEFRVHPQKRQRKFQSNFYLTFFSNSKVIFVLTP